MKILILEFITGGGMVDMPLPEHLVIEAQLMLEAIVTDMLELKQLELSILRDTRLPKPLLEDQDHHYNCIQVTPNLGFQSVWQQAIQQVDAVLPIAPENMGILTKLCADVEHAGKLLLTSSSDAVDLTSNKLETYRALQQAQIPVVYTQSLDDSLSIPPPWVIKPNTGLGCDKVIIIENRQTLNDFIKAIDLNSIDGIANINELIIQPWLAGEAGSLSVVFNQNNACLLTYNKQLIETKLGQMSLNGCLVGEQTRHWESYQTFVKRIAKCFPGLKGYVGIDVIETIEGPVIVEINPRLTTSYAGIHKALGINPAQLILDSFTTDCNNPGKITMDSINPVSIGLSTLHAH